MMHRFVRREETQTDQCHLIVDVFVLQTYKDKFAMALISLLNIAFSKTSQTVIQESAGYGQHFFSFLL